MKKINYIVSIIAIIFVFVSCDKEEFEPVVGVYTPPTMEDVSGTFVFSEDQVDDVFKTFSWSKADFGFPSATNYTLQLDVAGNGFADRFGKNQRNFCKCYGWRFESKATFHGC